MKLTLLFNKVQEWLKKMSLGEEAQINLSDSDEIMLNGISGDPIQDKFINKNENFVTDLATISTNPCKYLANGCNEQFDVNDLHAHEKACVFRNITCPSLDCKAKIVFNTILGHFQNNHTNMESRDEVLEFKGTIDTLKTSTFILNSYKKPFFPQFFVNGNLLNIWVITHGDCLEEASSFNATISFFINGKCSQTMCDLAKPMNTEKTLLTSGKFGMSFVLRKLTEYFDHETKNYKNQDYIEFQLKITCEKLDEIAKDENVESGVEDTDEDV